MKKNIVITGTSRGIGLELVKLFAAKGHEILALSRNSKPVDALQLDQVTSFSFDLTKSEAHTKAVNFIKKEWKTVDVLIHNAGQFYKNQFKNITLAKLRAVYETNVFGVFGFTQALLPYFKPQSHIVTISSMGGIQGSVKFPELSAYSSSKAAAINLTELLAEEHKETGPIFNALALGAVQTEMFEEAFPGQKAGLSAQEMAKYIKQFSLTGQNYYNGKVLQVSNSTP